MPKSKIVFLSENNSFDGRKRSPQRRGMRYALKSDGGRQVIAAVQAVLQGDVFISAAVSKQHFLIGDVAGNCYLLVCRIFAALQGILRAPSFEV